MHKTNSILLTDSYKLSHAPQYLAGTTLIFDNFTPRGDKYAPKNCQGKGVVVYGTSHTFIKLRDHFDENFFLTKQRQVIYTYMKSGALHKAIGDLKLKRLRDSVLLPVKKKIETFLGAEYDISRFEALWDLGYLPLNVRALEEGTICPIRVPMLTLYNTLPEFFWLPNYLESILSAWLWKPMTSATIAKGYHRIVTEWALKTTGSIAGTEWQGHDFSMRGLDGEEATIASGMGHLTSFWGTDSLPTLEAIEYYHGDDGFIAGSVPATEHSVMCAGGKEDELETYSRLMDLHPTGILSVVSDTWDLWHVVTNILPQLKSQIMAREGKLVIRPDSGDPVDILCGLSNNYQELKYFPEGEVLPKYFEDYLLEEVREDTPHGEHGVNEYTQTYLINGKLYKATIHNISWNRHDKQYYYIDMFEKAKITLEEVSWEPKDRGVVELLWDEFGGHVNELGYKVLNSHIGTIYGDSITPERMQAICERLEAKGFASTNVVFGIGSYTYQYNTRDTFGFAMKATYVEREESKPKFEGDTNTEIVGFNIFKDPVTDDGLKKSAKGLIRVVEKEGKLEVEEECTWDQINSEENMLKPLFLDGMILNVKSFAEIRETVKNQA